MILLFLGYFCYIIFVYQIYNILGLDLQQGALEGGDLDGGASGGGIAEDEGRSTLGGGEVLGSSET